MRFTPVSYTHLEQPMTVQTPDPNVIVCKDCVYRDKSTFNHKGTIIPIGITRSWCEVYTPDISNGKPIEILMNNAKCKYYLKDDD